MGPDSKMMGSLIGFPIDVLEIAESERVPITLNPSNNVTHIISRNLFFIAEKLDESFIVTFEDDGLEAAIHSKTHSMVQRISLCKQRVVVARNFPSSRSAIIPVSSRQVTPKPNFPAVVRLASLLILIIPSSGLRH
jgi:hypothetical protein